MFFTDRGIEELEHRRRMNVTSAGRRTLSRVRRRQPGVRRCGRAARDLARPGRRRVTTSAGLRDVRICVFGTRSSPGRRPEGAGLGRSGGGEDPAINRCRPDRLPARRPGPDDRGRRRSNATGGSPALCSRRRTRRGARGRRRGRLHRLPGGPVGRHPRVRPAVDAGSPARCRPATGRPGGDRARIAGADDALRPALPRIDVLHLDVSRLVTPRPGGGTADGVHPRRRPGAAVVLPTCYAWPVCRAPDSSTAAGMTSGRENDLAEDSPRSRAAKPWRACFIGSTRSTMGGRRCASRT